MEYASEKWGAQPHYRGEMVHLGDDEDGAWLWGDVGRTIYRGEAPLFVTEYPVLTLVPPGAWWALAWWIGHPELELYVNINTPADWGEDRIVYVDLDLDVIRTVDGTVELVDRDEFEEHQVSFGYPADIIARAETAAAEAFELTSARAAPFDGVAAQHWLARARARS